MSTLATDRSNWMTRHFVDREEPVRLFEEAEYAIKNEAHQVLTFHGLGGQGKTQLRYRLEEILSKKAPPHLSWGAVDLNGQVGVRPAHLLLQMRNAVKKNTKNEKISFPLFDLAFGYFWKDAHPGQPSPMVEENWWDLVSVATGTAAQFLPIPYLAPVLEKVGRAVAKYAYDKLREHEADAKTHLYSRETVLPSHEIERRLPAIFVRDLQLWQKDRPGSRFLFMFDQYDSILEEGGASNLLRPNNADSAVRELVSMCSGALFVFFSREQLNWERVDPSWAKRLDGRQHQLCGLSEKHAEAFLELAGVANSATRSTMIEAASVRPRSNGESECFPLMLDLGVTLLENATSSDQIDFHIADVGFSAKRHELLSRVLRSYGAPLQATLVRLAVCRRFDRAVFAFIVNAFRTGVPLDAWSTVASLSFVRPMGEGNHLTFHDLVRQGLEATMARDELLETHRLLFQHFEEAATVKRLPDVSYMHVASAAEAFHHCNSYSPREALLWWEVKGSSFRNNGLDRFLEEIDLACVSIAVASFGNGSIEHAAAQERWAGNLDTQGRYSEAEALHRRALAVREAIEGDAARGTAASLDGLAYNVGVQGRYAEAEALQRRALAIREALGPSDRDIAMTLRNLGSTLDSCGRHGEAEGYHRRASAIWERGDVLAPLDMAVCMDSLAWNLDAQGKHTEAADLYQRALAICEKEVGPRSPRVADSLDGLGWSLDVQGLHAQAQAKFLRGFRIRRLAWGMKHHLTATSLANLAGSTAAQGQYARAERFYRRALDVLEKVRPASHWHTAAVRSDLAACIDERGRFSEAAPLHHEAITCLLAAFGEAHARTCWARYKFARHRDFRGDRDGATLIGQRALETLLALSGLADWRVHELQQWMASRSRPS